jgi:hypothetical protein
LGISKAKYYEICEVTNTEPDPEKIPVEYSDLLLDTQLAMVIVNLLPDKWDGASGFFQGKDLSILPYLLELYEIDNKIDMISLITVIINESAQITNNKLKKKVKK